MFWRPKQHPTEPLIEETKPTGEMPGGQKSPGIGSQQGSQGDKGLPDGGALKSKSFEDHNDMPALADKLDSTQYADTALYGKDDQRRTGSAMKFTYSTGDCPLDGFEIKRGIGVGGFGEVYFAISEAGKEVAMKRVQRNLDVELRGVSHCMNLKHPNLIDLYDTKYDASEQAWVIMEYVAGSTLRDVLMRSPDGLTEQETLRWFGDLGAGVAYLHQQGIVHRDLKPGNVFDDDGIVKIGDYGLSKYISCSRRGGHTESVGTFHYMAPEIGRGEYGKEIDIYALGIILFEMLTGTVPFDGESSQEIIMKHLTSDPDLSAVPQPYRAVIWKALQKNPDARQKDVGEMLSPLGVSIDSHGLARVDGIVSPVGAPVIEVAVPVDSTEPLAVTVEPDQVINEAIDTESFDYHSREAIEQLHATPGARADAALQTDRGSEPLAHAIRQSASDLGHWWSSAHMHPLAKLMVVGVAVMILMVNSAWLLPMLWVAAIAYVPYYIIRTMVLTAKSQASYAAAHSQAVADHNQRLARPTEEQWRQETRRQLGAKPLRTRGAELSESWMTSLVTLAVLGWATTMFATSGTEIGPKVIAPFVWGSVTALFGSWMMLGLGKLWEREDGEGLPRRIVQLGVGALVGAFAYALGTGLMIPLNQDLHMREAIWDLPSHMYSNGQIRLPAMMAYFAIIFASVRWWRNADPMRSKRLSIWSVASVVVVAWAANMIVPMPRTWSLLTVGGMAVAIQMSAAWQNPAERLKPASLS